MLYYLSPLRDYSFGFNIFSYITFRTGLAAVSAFLLSLALGPWVMELLKKWGLIHKPKVFGPDHNAKAGIPVGGGLLILVCLIASILLWAKLANRFVLIALALLVLFGVLGFWDDWTKIKRPPRAGKSEGISSRIKFILQV